jgi:hypothetical protein
MHRWPLLAVLLAVSVSAQSTAPGQPAPPRDTPGQAPASGAAAATGKISGRVVAADTGKPISRARVNLTSPQGGGRGVLTDNAGAFELSNLPAGRFTLQVSKAGFIALQYGQRRPLQPGTPIQLAAGQELKGVDFRLPQGGVVAGQVLDENSDPMPGIQIRVLEYRYAQGARTLVDAGNAQTDDRGEYRVWGLNPGTYYVSAQPNSGLPPDFVGRGLPPGGRGVPPPSGSDTPALGYAPTYYPGVLNVSDARPVAIGLSAEARDISFGVSLVRTARVSGRVANPDGTPASGGNLTLVTDGPGRNGGPTGRTYGAGIAPDGQFAFVNVPPGRYTLRLRSGNGNARGRGAPMPTAPMFASTPIVVSGEDVADIQIAFAPAAGLSGSATLDNTQTASPPPLNQFRVSAPPSDFDGSGNGQTQPDAKTGAFNIDGLAPGEHILQTQAPRGWALKSATIDGRDASDLPFDLRSGQKLTNVTLVFTDKITEIDGTVADGKGSPLTEFTVLAFPDDQSFWRPQSRHIMTARPDQNGKFQIRGLPAGQYYLALIDPAEPGEWFDPSFLDAQRNGAKHFLLGNGETRTEDFSISR